MTILIFKTITRCYGKRVTVFVIAIAAGDSLKYQPLFYGSFVLGEIHVRYNKIRYDLTLVDLTSNFFVLSTNVKVYLYTYPQLVELSINIHEGKG